MKFPQLGKMQISFNQKLHVEKVVENKRTSNSLYAPTRMDMPYSSGASRN